MILELMNHATYSFAFRNAFPELEDAANFITRSNEEDPVMKTIIQMLSLQVDVSCLMRNVSWLLLWERFAQSL